MAGVAAGGTCAGSTTPLFGITGDVILNGGDPGVLVFVAGADGQDQMAIAATPGMLPLRDLQLAFISRAGVLRMGSGLIEYGAAQPERMGGRPLGCSLRPVASQLMVDGSSKGDWRGGRSTLGDIVSPSTSAAKWVGRMIPKTEDRLAGWSSTCPSRTCRWRT